MTAAGYYPCAKVLSAAFPGGDECVHGAQDVAKLINNIIREIEECSMEMSTHVIEWEKFIVDPIIQTISDERREYVNSFLKNILSRKELLKENFSMFYSQRNEMLCQSQKFVLNGIIKDVYPSNGIKLPLSVSNDIMAYGNLNDFIQSVDGYSLYMIADNPSSLKCALFCGCVSFLNKNHPNESIEWDDFKIGDDFYDSLVRNQGAKGQEFSSVVYETIIHALCRHPKNEVKAFRVSADSPDQRIVGDLKGFRTHITSRHQALRLMFWVDSSRIITLANIGPKFEETISLP